MNDEAVGIVITNLAGAYGEVLAAIGRGDSNYAHGCKPCDRLRDLAYHLGLLYPDRRISIAAAVRMNPHVWGAS